MKILLAIDGSPCSELAVEETCARPWPEDSEIRVLTAFELPLPPTPDAWAVPQSYVEDMDVAVRGQAQLTVENAVAKLKSKVNKSIKVDGKFLPGPPRGVILEEAENWGAELIVIGSHGYRGLQRFLLGSVSLAVVSHAKCSVEVVRCAQAAQVANASTVLKGKER